MTALSFSVAKAVNILPEVLSAELPSSGSSGNFTFYPLPGGWLTNPAQRMAVRRLAKGSAAAVEAAARISEEKDPDFIIFSSRHGELSKSEKILTALAKGEGVSPADFSYSVHNSAAGVFSIIKKLPVPATSIAAGADSFHYALLDAIAGLTCDFESALLVDFENTVPSILGASFPAEERSSNYATAFFLTRGNDWTVEFQSADICPVSSKPSSLQCLEKLISRHSEFETTGAQSIIKWRKNCD